MKDKGPSGQSGNRPDSKINLEKEFDDQVSTDDDSDKEEEPKEDQDPSEEKGDAQEKDENNPDQKETPPKDQDEEKNPSPAEDPAKKDPENEDKNDTIDKEDDTPKSEKDQDSQDPKKEEDNSKDRNSSPTEQKDSDKSGKTVEDKEASPDEESTKEDKEESNIKEQQNTRPESLSREQTPLPGQVDDAEDIPLAQDHSKNNKDEIEGLTLHALLVADLDQSTTRKANKIVSSEKCKEINQRGKYGETCLHVLMTPRESDFTYYIIALIYQLVDAGADVNVQDRDGFTALHLAAWNDLDHRIAAALLKLGTDPRLRTNKGQTALDVADQPLPRKVIRTAQDGLWPAVEESNVPLTRELLNAWFTIRVKQQGKDAEELASTSDNTRLVTLMEEQKATNILVQAVLMGDVTRTKQILAQKKANVNTRDQSYLRPDSKLSPMPLLAWAVMLGKEETAKVLYQVGKADSNLLIDTEHGDEPVFYYLIKRAPPVSPELLAILVKKADMSLVRAKILAFLIELGTRELPDKANEPLVEKALVNSGQTLGQRGRDGYTLRDRLLLCSYRLPLQQCFSRLRLLDMQVMRMVRKGDEAGMRRLLLEGYDYTDITDTRGKTMEEVAAEEGQTKILNLLKDLPELQEKRHALHRAIEKGNLAEVKVSLNAGLAAACDQAGFSPLHKAVMYERRFIIKHILENHPEEVHRRDILGRTPLHYAWYLTTGQDIKDALCEGGADKMIKDVNGNIPGDMKGPEGYQALLKARQLPPARGTYLLNHYLRLLQAIEVGSLKQVIYLVNSTLVIPEEDLDEYLPKTFPKLDYISPVFACVNQNQEDIAVELIQLGAGYQVSYKVMLEPESPRNGEIMTLKEAAMLKNMYKLLEAIREREQQQKAPQKPHKGSQQGAGNPPSDNYHNSNGQDNPAQPPPKKSGVCTLM